MGFFSDRCEALIDASTQRMLQGEGLARARQNPDAPRCGNQVRKAARFCNRCGAPSPGGWWQCPHCQKWVGAEANFCWNCQAALHPDARQAITGGVWQRQPGMFARRIEAVQLRQLLDQGLIIEMGTVALLLEAGRIKEVLEPGRHTLAGAGRKLLDFFVTSAPRSVVLVDAGDIVLPLRFSGLRAREELPVEAYTEVCFRFLPARGEAFLANVLKGQDQLDYEGLADWLRQEIRGTLAGAVQSAAMDDLVRDPQWRLRLEDLLRQGLAVALERAGVELVRVAALEFTGAEYEELRALAGQVEVKRRELEFQHRLRELTTSGELDRLKTETELEEYVRQLGQEKAVSTQLQEHELARLKQVHRHELDKAEAAWQMAEEMERTARDIEIKLQWDDYTRDKLLKDTGLREQVQQIESREEIRQTREWLQVRAEKRRLDLEAQQAQAGLLAGLDIKTLVALLPDNAQRQQLLELQRQMAMAGLSAEQILAMAAANSPAAAAAVAKMRELKREDLEREFHDRRQISDESAARLERVLTEALKAMAEYSHPQAVFRNPGVSGGPGNPV